jgi:RNA polymerase sigma-70 factor (ECF subfamily)
LEPDAQLVQSCLQGDGSSWEEIVRRHTRRVYGLCYRFTGDSTDSEDMTQEVFLRVYRTLASYKPDQGAFTTWLSSVTRNLLVDNYRRTRHERLTDSIDEPQEEDGPSKLDGIQSAWHTPHHVAEQAELSVQLQRALERLSPELREAVILRDLQELEYSEVQAVLQVPEGTVKSRINRGRIELARVLQEMGVRPA